MIVHETSARNYFRKYLSRQYEIVYNKQTEI